MPKNQTALVCNKCGIGRTFLNDGDAITFRTKPCFNPDCDAVGDFRKTTFRELGDSIGFRGDLATQTTTPKLTFWKAALIFGFAAMVGVGAFFLWNHFAK